MNEPLRVTFMRTRMKSFFEKLPPWFDLSDAQSRIDPSVFRWCCRATLRMSVKADVVELLMDRLLAVHLVRSHRCSKHYRSLHHLAGFEIDSAEDWTVDLSHLFLLLLYC